MVKLAAKRLQTLPGIPAPVALSTAPRHVRLAPRRRRDPIEEPIDTISTRDRFGLVQPVINGYTLDIRFRMLQPHELAAATSFPRGYVFKGTREEVVKQIGNAWPGRLAKALCASALADFARNKTKAHRVA